MKDLKHLIYFENLLDSANNELVQQAKDEGMHPIAYTCYHMPEVVAICFIARRLSFSQFKQSMYMCIQFFSHKRLLHVIIGS